MNSKNTTLTPFLLWVMTIATGLCVANLYYCQPLLYQMQVDLGVTEVEMGAIPTLTQLGYALGMLFLIPLGDLYEKKKLILLSTFVSALALIGMAFSPNLSVAIFMSLLIGITTMTPHFIIPFAVQLSGTEKSGRVVGMIMGGLLLGILLARTFAGFVGAEFGWRAMFLIAATMLIILSVLLFFVLPESAPGFKGSYKELITSIWTLVKEQPVLRESMLYGSVLFGGFSAFWATLIYLMESPAFNLGARTVGLFGLAGALGALAAPIVGRYAEKKDPRITICGGILCFGLSFVIYLIWGGSSLIALVVGVLLMDLGLQVAHISNQTRNFALVPDAKSRMSTAYMFAYFIGGATGSWLGAFAWGHWGWSGVCLTAILMTCIAGVVFFRSGRRVGPVISAA